MARQRDREVNQRGALFPGRTINGEEASAYYAAGTAQYHINADIMFALKKYVEITGDEAFLHSEGAEMLVETARLWRDLGFFSDNRKGRFCIIGVTGPDEYNTVVNNNTFTNLMARENLWFAAATVRTLHDQYRDLFEALVHKTGVALHEVDEWERAAEMMYLPIDEKLGIHLQDEGFLEKRPWDFTNTPAELSYALSSAGYHRHRVIKQ
jgi:alpha,alpha-trehalose phosphorylase